MVSDDSRLQEELQEEQGQWLEAAPAHVIDSFTGRGEHSTYCSPLSLLTC